MRSDLSAIPAERLARELLDRRRCRVCRTEHASAWHPDPANPNRVRCHGCELKGTPLRDGWVALHGPVSGRMKGNAYRHEASGWFARHVGHPTAIWPYFLVQPGTGAIVVSFNGLGFRYAGVAQWVAEQVVAGRFHVEHRGKAYVVPEVDAGGDPVSVERPPRARRASNQAAEDKTMPKMKTKTKKKAGKRPAKKGGARSRGAPAKKARAASTRKVHGRGANDPRLPAPGSEIRKVYKDREIVVTYTGKDFTWEGRSYRSLSGIAKEVVGGEVNGFLFFGLTGRDGKPPAAAAEPAKKARKPRARKTVPAEDREDATHVAESTEAAPAAEDEDQTPPEDRETGEGGGDGD